MRLLRPILIVLAVGVWIESIRLLFEFSFQWRGDYDAQLSPHDGQIGLDAFAFALLICLGYVLASMFGVLLINWRRRRRKRS